MTHGTQEELGAIRAVERKWAGTDFNLSGFQKTCIMNAIYAGKSIDHFKSENEKKYYQYIKELDEAAPKASLVPPDLSDDFDTCNLSEELFKKE